MSVEALRGMGFPISRGGAAHGEVQKCLHNAGDPAVTAVAGELGAMHSRRIRADYRLDAADVKKHAEADAAVTHAEEMIQAIDNAFNGTNRAQLEAAIRQWRRSNGYP